MFKRYESNQCPLSQSCFLLTKKNKIHISCLFMLMEFYTNSLLFWEFRLSGRILVVFGTKALDISTLRSQFWYCEYTRWYKTAFSKAAMRTRETIHILFPELQYSPPPCDFNPAITFLPFHEYLKLSHLMFFVVLFDNLLTIFLKNSTFTQIKILFKYTMQNFTVF